MSSDNIFDNTFAGVKQITNTAMKGLSMETGVAVNRKSDALEISLDGRLIYDIELGSVTTPEQVQFWLRQIKDKKWCSPEVLCMVSNELSGDSKAARNELVEERISGEQAVLRATLNELVERMTSASGTTARRPQVEAVRGIHAQFTSLSTDSRTEGNTARGAGRLVSG